MIRSLVIATDQDDLIGVDGHLPWKLPSELTLFQQTTRRGVVIMGRRTFDSIGCALRERWNIVVSADRTRMFPDCTVVSDLATAWTIAEGSGKAEAFIIGGARLFEAAQHHIDRAYVTRVHARINTSLAREVVRFPVGPLVERATGVVGVHDCPASPRNSIAWTRTTHTLVRVQD